MSAILNICYEIEDKENGKWTFFYNLVMFCDIQMSGDF